MARYDESGYGMRQKYEAGRGYGTGPRYTEYDRDYGYRSEHRGGMARPGYGGRGVYDRDYRDRFGGSYRGARGYDREFGSRERYQGQGSYGHDRDYNRNRGGGRDSGGRYERSPGMAGLYTDLDEGRARGRHVGRGPSNYQRSDERIHEDVNEELTRHPDLDATHIQVQVRDRTVTLEGAVESRQAKRTAEHCADRISGVADVQNNLRIQRGAESGGGATANQSADAESQGATGGSQRAKSKQTRKRGTAAAQASS